ncbi:hypothetical protein AGMMS50249_5140 [candidate division SR1 bacterium]|nr:hypothetical protein AGMMS50249_5140 [candidate division SR1 bacterium]
MPITAFPSRVQDEVFPVFTKLLDPDKQIFIAVSAGCDSMVLACLLIMWWNDKNYSLSNLHIVHCNHKIRPESGMEAEFVAQFFVGFQIHLFERDVNLPITERDLRNWRYDCFRQAISSCSAQNNSLLALGHNLNDRIESTFLNLMRGCSRDGFCNMQTIQSHILLNQTPALRPLLYVSKKQILDLCDQQKIPFFTDQTNFDPSISKRNNLRQKIFDKLEFYDGKPTKFLESMKNIYAMNLDLIQFSYGFESKSFPVHASRGVKSAFYFPLPETSADLVNIRKKLNLIHNLRSSQLQEWISRIHGSGTGRKQLGNSYFFKSSIAGGSLIVLDVEKAQIGEHFWEKYLNISIPITALGPIEIGGLTVQISKDSRIGAILRYPQSGDTFAGKTRNRWCINQKIPLIWRNFIPVIVQDGKILHMFKEVCKIGK